MRVRLAFLLPLVGFVGGLSAPSSQTDGADTRGTNQLVASPSASTTSSVSNSPGTNVRQSFFSERNAETGTKALLRIEVTDQGTFNVYDMQGNLIDSHPSDATQDLKGNSFQEKGASSKRVEDHPKSPDAKPYDGKTHKAKPHIETDLLQEKGTSSKRVEDHPKTPDAKPQDGKIHNAKPHIGRDPSPEKKGTEDQPRNTNEQPYNWKDETQPNSFTSFNIRTDPQGIDPQIRLGSSPNQNGWSPAHSPLIPNLTLYTGSGSVNVYTYNGSTHVLEIFSSVWNNGTTAAGSFRIGWYLSLNNIITTADYLVGTGVQPGLASGFFVNWNLSVDVDDVIPPIPGGTYYVGVYFDDLFQVPESNEGDNTAVYMNTIFYPGLPNLALYTGSGSVNVYTYNGSTHVLEIFSSVWNSGATAAGSFRIGWYLSLNNIITTADYLVGTGVQPGLAGGFYVNWNLSVDVDDVTPPVPAGTYYVGVYFDDQSQVAEFNESDNTAVYMNTIFYPGGPGGVELTENIIPERFSLGQNYPNPFNPTTTIRFALPSSSYVILTVYDVVGREVATLVNEELKPGSYQTTFDATSLSGGVYFYRLQAHQQGGEQTGGFEEARKLVLLK